MKKIIKKPARKTSRPAAAKPGKKTAGRAALKTRVKRSVKKAVKKSAARPAARPAAKAAAPAAVAITRTELTEAAKLLLEMRERVVRTMEEKKKLDLPEADGGDSIDQAYQSLEKEILFELSDSEMANLSDIESALRKMDNGTYGTCEHCQKIIEKKRMKALPAARYCLPCQSGSEKQRAR